MNPIADIVAGAVLLVLGRKLFWLFVAIAGFYFGFEVARTLAAQQPAWLLWTMAIGAGLIGAVLAMLLQRVGFALGGFYAGGYIALLAIERFAPGAMGVAAFFVGGVIGAVLALLLMDWAIVVLSCLVGAALVVPVLGLQPLASAFAYAGLVAAGIVVQAQFTAGTPRPSAAQGSGTRPPATGGHTLTSAEIGDDKDVSQPFGRLPQLRYSPCV